MARRMREPSASRPGTGTAWSKGVSPAVAVVVIVIVLALVAAVWLRFTSSSGVSSKAGEREGPGFPVERINPQALQQLRSDQKTQEALQRAREAFAASKDKSNRAGR